MKDLVLRIKHEKPTATQLDWLEDFEATLEDDDLSKYDLSKPKINKLLKIKQKPEPKDWYRGTQKQTNLGIG